MRLPLKSFVRIREELGPGQLGPISDVRHVKLVLPSGKQVLPGGIKTNNLSPVSPIFHIVLTVNS